VIDLTISTHGERAIQMQLKQLANADEVIHDVLGEWAAETLDSELYGMDNYAPPPPNSTYVRTGRLGANWGLQRQGRTAVAFTNFTRYVRYVVGDAGGAGQAWMHAGRWWLGRRKVEERIPKLAQMLKARFDRLTK
jgi:hypothetical protein